MAPEKLHKTKEGAPEEAAIIAKEIEIVPEQRKEWQPVTELGKKVKNGSITDINEIFAQGYNILEAGIVDALVPNIQEDLLLIGQAKGKFGGGQRRIFRQTQKKTQEGNKIKFTTLALVGNKDGYVGLGLGKSKETVPSRDKAKRTARLHLMRIRRGCGSWQCNCHTPHSIPFEVTGKCGSSEITLIPAPKGKGLCVEKECAKILAMAGIKDVWSKTSGQTKTKLNLVGALTDALVKLSRIKIKPEDIDRLGIVEGSTGSSSITAATPIITKTSSSSSKSESPSTIATTPKAETTSESSSEIPVGESA